jgi:uncharacterized protein (DUF952 family)
VSEDAQGPGSPTAWKVLTDGQFRQFEADGSFVGAPVDLADGYIHMSTLDQLDETLAKHFGGQSDLWLVCVDLTVLGDAVKWEPSRGGALFPHLYAPLPLTAALAYGPIERDSDGKLKLPVAG